MGYCTQKRFAPTRVVFYVKKMFTQNLGIGYFKQAKTAKTGQNLEPKILKIGYFRGLLPITNKGIFEKISPPRVCSAGAPPLKLRQNLIYQPAPWKGTRAAHHPRLLPRDSP